MYITNWNLNQSTKWDLLVIILKNKINIFENKWIKKKIEANEILKTITNMGLWVNFCSMLFSLTSLVLENYIFWKSTKLDSNSRICRQTNMQRNSHILQNIEEKTKVFLFLLFEQLCKYQRIKILGFDTQMGGWFGKFQSGRYVVYVHLDKLYNINRFFLNITLLRKYTWFKRGN
jgi:hypothetical protein